MHTADIRILTYNRWRFDGDQRAFTHIFNLFISFIYLTIRCKLDFSALTLHGIIVLRVFEVLLQVGAADEHIHTVCSVERQTTEADQGQQELRSQ